MTSVEDFQLDAPFVPTKKTWVSIQGRCNLNVSKCVISENGMDCGYI